MRTPQKYPDQTGKIAIVTGANSGLGFETALALAKLNAHVILACRDMANAEKAKQTILQACNTAKLDVMHLDLQDLASVHNFAGQFTATNTRLDLLINNAGIMMPSYSKTKDRLEGQMAANYFGHFLLTSLLLPVIKHTPAARVVMLSSLAHAYGKIDFDNLNSSKKYSKIGAYATSKLACLMFTTELQRRFEAHNFDCIAVAAHPGISATALFKHMPKWVTGLFSFAMSWLTQPASMGALPTLMAALQPGITGGSYFGPTEKREMKGPPGPAKIDAKAFDKEVAKKLWATSEDLVHFSYQF